MVTQLPTDNPFQSTWADDSATEASPPTVIKNTMYYIYTVGEILIAFASAFGNALVIHIIIKERRLHTTTNCFIASLASADLLVGILGIPCAVVAFNGIPKDPYGCLMVNTMIVILTQISIFGLLVIAIERFLAIKFPFEYQKHCTPNTACVVICVYWVAAILVGMVPMFGWNLMDSYEPVFCAFMEIIDMNYMVYFNFFGFVLIPLIIMFLIYCYIYHVVRKQNQQIASLQVVVVTPSENPHIHTSKAAIHKQNYKRELRAAKWFAVVIGFFAFCWLPLHIINTFGIYGYPAPVELLVFTIILSHFNSAVNPVLYAYSNHKFKAAMKRAFGFQITSEDMDSLGITNTQFQNNVIASRTNSPKLTNGSQSLKVGNGRKITAEVVPTTRRDTEPMSEDENEVRRISFHRGGHSDGASEDTSDQSGKYLDNGLGHDNQGFEGQESTDGNDHVKQEVTK